MGDVLREAGCGEEGSGVMEDEIYSTARCVRN